MLIIPKSATCFSTANLDKEGNVSLPKKGNKGRQELFAERTEDGFRLQFEDRGNYGRERWRAEFNDLGASDILSIITQLEALVDGNIDSTSIPFELPAEPEAETEAPAEEAEEAELSAEDVEELPAEVLETPEEETEQIEA